MSLMDLSTTALRSRRLPSFNELRALIAEWRERARSRYELQMLDDRGLCDVGLTRMDAKIECDKPFWQP